MAERLMRQVLYEMDFLVRQETMKGPYATGNLSAHTYSRGPLVTANGVLGRVGNDASYARIVHDGARIHEIFPKVSQRIYRFGDHRRPQLRFFWRKVGKVVYMPHVPGSSAKIGRSHPGQPGKRFLVGPLFEVAARHNMKVVVYDI